MINMTADKQIVLGKVYMVETAEGKTQSLRILNVTPTHYIFSTIANESVEVFEKDKNDITGIYELKEWCQAHPEDMD